jgi:hypothetical protein
MLAARHFRAQTSFNHRPIIGEMNAPPADWAGCGEMGNPHAAVNSIGENAEHEWPRIGTNEHD